MTGDRSSKTFKIQHPGKERGKWYSVPMFGHLIWILRHLEVGEVIVIERIT